MRRLVRLIVETGFLTGSVDLNLTLGTCPLTHPRSPRSPRRPRPLHRHPGVHLLLLRDASPGAAVLQLHARHIQQPDPDPPRPRLAAHERLRGVVRRGST